MNLADHFGTANLQPRATRFANDSEGFHNAAAKKGLRLGQGERPLRPGCLQATRLVPDGGHTLLPPPSYHALKVRVLGLCGLKCRGQLVTHLGRLRAGGHNDFFGFVWLPFDDVHQFLPLVGGAGRRFVRVSKP